MSTEAQSPTVVDTTEPPNRSFRSTLQELVIVGVAFAWIFFWGMLALTHIERTDMVSTLVTGVGFTLPVVLALLYRYAKRRYERA